MITRVIGIGTTLHKFINPNGKELLLLSVSYHLTQTYVQLFSPQTYPHMHGGYSDVYDIKVSIYFIDNRIHITIDR